MHHSSTDVFSAFRGPFVHLDFSHCNTPFGNLFSVEDTDKHSSKKKQKTILICDTILCFLLKTCVVRENAPHWDKTMIVRPCTGTRRFGKSETMIEG